MECWIGLEIIIIFIILQIPWEVGGCAQTVIQNPRKYLLQLKEIISVAVLECLEEFLLTIHVCLITAY